MAEIFPFRGIRYNPNVVDPGEVTSPPYDVISPNDNVYFHSKHPKNVVRLILGQELSDDNETNNRFNRSAAFLYEWLAEGTLVRDQNPAIYAYEQHYLSGGKERTVRGFTTLVRLHDYSDGVILPHENTLARPKSDLAKLIRITKANLDSVLGIYPDMSHTVDAVLERIASNPPVEEAVDRDGVRHRLWIIDQPDDINTITQTLAGRPVVIADGHHRYETALAYRNEMREKENNPSEDRPYDYVMMTLVNVYSPDVVVLPTHRLVHNVSDDLLAHFKLLLKDFFDLKESSKETLLKDMEHYEGKAIGVVQPGSVYVIIPKSGISLPVTGSAAARGLDLIILHQIIFDGMLGISADVLKAGTHVTYTREEAKAFKCIESGECQAAFILNPIRLETIMNMAEAGERLPQKATYFYPKLLSGLVMRRIDEE